MKEAPSDIEVTDGARFRFMSGPGYSTAGLSLLGVSRSICAIFKVGSDVPSVLVTVALSSSVVAAKPIM